MKVQNVRRCITVVAVAAVAGVIAPATAQAHDWVTGSVPEEGAVLTEFPDEIELNFSAEPQPNFNTIAVSDTDTEEILFTGEPTLDGNVIHIDLPEDLDPGDGSYQVGYQITSSDGHSTRGNVGFSVESTDTAGGGETADDDAEVAPAVEDDEGGVPGWAIGIGVGVVVLVVAVVAGVAAVTRKKG